MKTHRELLEAAAKAAGINASEWVDAGEISDKAGFVQFVGMGQLCVWNPLTDDGDAFRLAIQLNIQVSQSEKSKWSHAELGNCITSWPWGDDKMAATRMAILETAAFPQHPKATP